MSSIIIHNIPIKLKKYLQKIAKSKGITLSEFLLEEIIKISNISTIEKKGKKIDRALFPKIKASEIVDAIKSNYN
jgi:hypothetical protein